MGPERIIPRDLRLAHILILIPVHSGGVDPRPVGACSGMQSDTDISFFFWGWGGVLNLYSI
jgi:hypothetical protein